MRKGDFFLAHFIFDSLSKQTTKKINAKNTGVPSESETETRVIFWLSS